MEMMSVAKLNRINSKLYAFRQYFLKLDSIVANLSGSIDLLSSDFFGRSSSQGKIGLCLITSYSGLCGSYNNNIIHLAEEFIDKHGKENVNLVILGRRGFSYFKKRRLEISNAYIGLNGRYSDKLFEGISADLLDSYLSGKFNSIYIAYTLVHASLVYKPVTENILEIKKSSLPKKNYILEPNVGRVLREIIPRYLSAKIKLNILEAFSSEHSARTVAMKMATDNANELLQKLTLQRNKVRQASITQDMMEIISSAEALKG